MDENTKHIVAALLASGMEKFPDRCERAPQAFIELTKKYGIKPEAWQKWASYQLFLQWLNHPDSGRAEDKSGT